MKNLEEFKEGDVVILVQVDKARDRHRRRAEGNYAIVVRDGMYSCSVRTYITHNDYGYYHRMVIHTFDMNECEEIIEKATAEEAMLYKLQHA